MRDLIFLLFVFLAIARAALTAATLPTAEATEDATALPVVRAISDADG